MTVDKMDSMRVAPKGTDRDFNLISVHPGSFAKSRGGIYSIDTRKNPKEVLKSIDWYRFGAKGIDVFEP